MAHLILFLFTCVYYGNTHTPQSESRPYSGCCTDTQEATICAIKRFHYQNPNDLNSALVFTNISMFLLLYLTIATNEEDFVNVLLKREKYANWTQYIS